MTTTGRVRFWKEEEGWGVIDCSETPGGCWAHFSVVAVEGYRALAAGQRVVLEWAAHQDGFSYRAVRTWPADRPPSIDKADPGMPSPAYSSTLTITYDVDPVPESGTTPPEGPTMFLGLRTVIFPAPDLAASKAWFSRLLGQEPYFDEPFYVAFNVAGYELALDPAGEVVTGPVTYWGVADADAALATLLGAGATLRGAVQDVGDGIRVATVLEPGGTVVGVIENPHFRLPDATEQTTGPGR